MKKVIFLTMIVFCLATMTKAQNDTIFYVNNMETIVDVCTNKYDTVLIYAAEDCTEFIWLIEGEEFSDNPVIITPEMCLLGTTSCHIAYAGCDHSYSRVVHFIEPNVPNETTEKIWIHSGELAELKAVENDSASMYNIHWDTGENENIIYKPAGTYIASISDLCATAYRTKIVEENVEIESASVDPDSNKNLVTWDVTPAQAEYITNVTVTRDGVDLATVPYTNGQFLDNIGSDLAARIYTVTGISVEGTPCPIPSLERGTIHMAFLPDINGNVEMTWNAPHLGGAPIHVGRFEICEYDPNTMEIAVIDFVSPSTMSYSCNQSMFNYGYPLIRAIIQEGRGEKDMLSNRTEDLVGLNEVEGKSFKIYPNPAKDRVTIEGTGTAIITNTLGQTVWAKEIESNVTIELPQGLYFVKLNGATRKIVVE